MPRRVASKRFPKLTWHESTGRWRKRYKGQTFYHPGRPTKIASYPEAVRAFEKWKLGIDQQRHEQQSAREAYSKVIRDVESWQAALVASFADTSESRSAYRELDKLLVIAKQEAERHSNDVGDEAQWVATQLRDYLHDRAVKIREYYDPDSNDFGNSLDSIVGKPIIETPSGPAPWEATFKPEVLDLDQLIAVFTHAKNRQVQNGELTQHRVDRLSTDLKHLLAFCGGETLLADLNSVLFSQYLDSVKSEVRRGIYSATTGQGRLRSAKQILTWAYQTEIIESLPRVFSSYSIKVQSKAVETLEDGELERFQDQSKPLLQLYTLLTLNCGMTQNDMADLKPSEVDWERGYLTRKRTKTEKHENVPTVSYQLWPQTFDALKEFGNRKGELLLTRTDGKRLVVGRSDSVRILYRRLSEKLGINVGPKILRKTAASKLGSHETFGRYAQHFLGHSPRTVADRHYVKPDQKQFDQAINWLGQQWNL